MGMIYPTTKSDVRRGGAPRGVGLGYTTPRTHLSGVACRGACHCPTGHDTPPTVRPPRPRHTSATLATPLSQPTSVNPTTHLGHAPHLGHLVWGVSRLGGGRHRGAVGMVATGACRGRCRLTMRMRQLPVEPPLGFTPDAAPCMSTNQRAAMCSMCSSRRPLLPPRVCQGRRRVEACARRRATRPPLVKGRGVAPGLAHVHGVGQSAVLWLARVHSVASPAHPLPFRGGGSVAHRGDRAGQIVARAAACQGHRPGPTPVYRRTGAPRLGARSPSRRVWAHPPGS